MQNFISQYAIFTPNIVKSDNNIFFENADNIVFSTLSKQIYSNQNISYLRYFKMDNLCKLAFLSSYILLKDVDLSQYQSDDIAIILQNKHSSIDTDINFQKNINEPSPATFVYTLPNIMIGEIAMYFKIKGENICFVNEKIRTENLFNYTNSLLQDNKAKAVITGFIDYLDENNFVAIIFFVEAKENICKFTAANINKIILENYGKSYL